MVCEVRECWDKLGIHVGNGGINFVEWLEMNSVNCDVEQGGRLLCMCCSIWRERNEKL